MAFGHSREQPAGLDTSDSSDGDVEGADFPLPNEEGENKKETEPTPEHENGEGSAEINARVAERFNEEFNITKEDLQTIEGFAELSDGQQRLVLDNFREMALNRIEEEGVKSFREDRAESGIFSSMWKGFLSSYYKAQAKAEAGERLVQEGGIDMHRGVLSDVVEQTKESGLSLDSTGQIEYAQELEGMSDRDAEIVARFNRVAQDFSETSNQWRYEDIITENITGSTREGYREKLEAYKEALKDYVDLAERSDELSVEDALEADKRVRFNQFFSSETEYEEAIQQIKNEPKGHRIWDNVAAEKGGYFAMGGIGRSISAGVLGYAAAPVVAATLAAIRGRTKAIESLEDEATVREGGGEATLSRNVGFGLDTVGPSEQQADVINAVSAQDLEHKINRLVGVLDDDIDTSDDPLDNDREQARQMLQRRISYTKKKLDDGLVDFGGADGRAGRQYSLLQELSRAQAVNEIENNPDFSDDVTDRLDRFLEYKDDKTKRYVHEKTARGAVMGAAFAGLGVAVSDWWHGDDVSEATEGAQEGASSSETQETPPSQSSAGNLPPELQPDQETETVLDVEISDWDGPKTDGDVTKARSFIEAVGDIQEQMQGVDVFDEGVSPDNLEEINNLQEFLEEGTANNLAERLEGYSPDDIKESLVVEPGETMSVTKEGNLILEHSDGSTDIIYNGAEDTVNTDAFSDDAFGDFDDTSGSETAQSATQSQDVYTKDIPDAEAVDPIDAGTDVDLPDTISVPETAEALERIRSRPDEANGILKGAMKTFLDAGGDPAYIDSVQLPDGMSQQEFSNHIQQLNQSQNPLVDLNEIAENKPEQFRSLQALMDGYAEFHLDPDSNMGVAETEDLKSLYVALDNYMEGDNPIFLGEDVTTELTGETQSGEAVGWAGGPADDQPRGWTPSQDGEAAVSEAPPEPPEGAQSANANVKDLQVGYSNEDVAVVNADVTEGEILQSAQEQLSEGQPFMYEGDTYTYVTETADTAELAKENAAASARDQLGDALSEGQTGQEGIMVQQQSVSQTPDGQWESSVLVKHDTSSVADAAAESAGTDNQIDTAADQTISEAGSDSSQPTEQPDTSQPSESTSETQPENNQQTQPSETPENQQATEQTQEAEPKQADAEAGTGKQEPTNESVIDPDQEVSKEQVNAVTNKVATQGIENANVTSEEASVLFDKGPDGHLNPLPDNYVSELSAYTSGIKENLSSSFEHLQTTSGDTGLVDLFRQQTQKPDPEFFANTVNSLQESGQADKLKEVGWLLELDAEEKIGWGQNLSDEKINVLRAFVNDKYEDMTGESLPAFPGAAE